MIERNALLRHLSQTGWWVASLLLFVGVWELAYGLGLYRSAALPPPHIFLPDLPAQAQHFDTAHLVAGAEFAGGTISPEVRAAYLATIPLGRFSTPLDIANACLYLASDEASFVSGTCIEVDGARCA